MRSSEEVHVEPFDNENVPLYTVGQVADMLSLKQAFLRRIDELQVVSPQRSAGRQRRYTRVEIRDHPAGRVDGGRGHDDDRHPADHRA